MCVISNLLRVRTAYMMWVGREVDHSSPSSLANARPLTRASAGVAIQHIHVQFAHRRQNVTPGAALPNLTVDIAQCRLKLPR